MFLSVFTLAALMMCLILSESAQSTLVITETLFFLPPVRNPRVKDRLCKKQQSKRILRRVLLLSYLPKYFEVGQSDEYGKRKWKHRHTCIHRHAISALVLQYYALMCKHMHTERLDFFQTSIDMHIYYKITAQDRRYVHIHAYMHSLSFFLALAESVKAQKACMFYQKHPSQHQTLHLTTIRSKKIMSLLHQTDHFRKTVCWFLCCFNKFWYGGQYEAVGTQNNQKSQSSLLFTFLLYSHMFILYDFDTLPRSSFCYSILHLSAFHNLSCFHCFP